MRLRPQSWDRRRGRRRAKKDARRRHSVEKEMAKQTELRHRDEHTGGYGDPPYGP